jgi:hypothetical protein
VTHRTLVVAVILSAFLVSGPQGWSTPRPPDERPKLFPVDQAREIALHAIASREYWTVEDEWSSWPVGTPLTAVHELTDTGVQRIKIARANAADLNQRELSLCLRLSRDGRRWCRGLYDDGGVVATQTFSLKIPSGWEPKTIDFSGKPLLDALVLEGLARYCWGRGLTTANQMAVRVTDIDPYSNQVLAVTDPPQYLIVMHLGWMCLSTSELIELFIEHKRCPPDQCIPDDWKHIEIESIDRLVSLRSTVSFQGGHRQERRYRSSLIPKVFKHGRKQTLTRPEITR